MTSSTIKRTTSGHDSNEDVSTTRSGVTPGVRSEGISNNENPQDSVPIDITDNLGLNNSFEDLEADDAEIPFISNYKNLQDFAPFGSNSNMGVTNNHEIYFVVLNGDLERIKGIQLPYFRINRILTNKKFSQSYFFFNYLTKFFHEHSRIKIYDLLIFLFLKIRFIRKYGN